MSNKNPGGICHGGDGFNMLQLSPPEMGSLNLYPVQDVTRPGRTSEIYDIYVYGWEQ